MDFKWVLYCGRKKNEKLIKRHIIFFFRASNQIHTFLHYFFRILGRSFQMSVSKQPKYTLQSSLHSNLYWKRKTYKRKYAIWGPITICQWRSYGVCVCFQVSQNAQCGKTKIFLSMRLILAKLVSLKVWLLD